MTKDLVGDKIASAQRCFRNYCTFSDLRASFLSLLRQDKFVEEAELRNASTCIGEIEFMFQPWPGGATVLPDACLATPVLQA
jgi:hypothetical protein